MLFKRKCKITFIAHGATLYTEENRICDKESHPPLNEQGQEEAERIAKWIIHRSPRVDKIYTGASLSCVQTAQYVAKEYGQEHYGIIGAFAGMAFIAAGSLIL